MAPLLDHLTAIVIGTIVLITLFVLQSRQRLTAVDETIHLSVREYTQEALGTLGGDLNNAINERRARADTSIGGFRSSFDPVENAAYMSSPIARTHASPVPGDYLFGVDTLANGMTGWLAFPAWIGTAAGGFKSAQVIYRLVPEVDTTGAPETAFVNGQARELYRLERWTSFTPDGTDPSSGFQPISGGIIADFRVELVGYSTEPVRKGPAPDGVHAVRVSINGAVDRLAAISTGQANTRESNGVRLAATYRPSDF